MEKEDKIERLFGVGEIQEWYELQSVCDQCGQYFIGDYKYTGLCWRCRYPELVRKTEE